MDVGGCWGNGLVQWLGAWLLKYRFVWWLVVGGWVVGGWVVGGWVVGWLVVGG